ncbi:MAG: hypothetical protein GX444_13375 [Myxococcales bacterium]|nr:hypothetical protein [Myxococcales bacterium]
MSAAGDAAPFRRAAGWILLAVLLAGGPTLWLPLGRDQGIGLYIADVLRHGGAPYKDAWEIRPPGIFYVYAAGLELFGKHGWSLRLLDLLWQGATALALGLLGHRLFGRWAGLIAGALYAVVYFLGNDFWNLGNTDAFVALPATLALLAVLPRARGPRWAWDLGAGLLIGAVFLLRFTHGLLFLPVIALFFAGTAGPFGARVRPVFGRLVAAGLGFGLAVGAYALHLVVTGAWSDFYYTLFVFAPRYAVLTHHGSAAAFLSFFRQVVGGFAWKYAVLVFPAGAMLAWAARYERHPFSVAAVLWIFGTLAGIAVMAKFYAYHWLPLFAPLALAAGWYGQRLAGAWRRRLLPAALLATALAVFGLGAFAVRFGALAPRRLADAWQLSTGALTADAYRQRFDTLSTGGDFSATANYRAADYLRLHTAPGDGVYIWGFETLIYFLADRRPPTRFCSNYPIVAKWHKREWYEELVAALAARPPAYVVLVTRDEMPWITGQGRDSTAMLKAEFPELRDFILNNYQAELVIENLVLCRYQPLAGQP